MNNICLGDIVLLVVGKTVVVNELGWPGNDFTYSGLTADGARSYFKIGQVVSLQPAENTLCEPSIPPQSEKDNSLPSIPVLSSTSSPSAE